MTIAITLLTIYTAILFAESIMLQRKIEELERETPAKIDSARHDAWYEGYLYANKQAERLHPRNREGQFTSKH